MAPVYLLVTLIVVIQLGLPTYLIYDAWRRHSETMWVWVLRVGASAAYLWFVLVTGRWDLLGYHLRSVLPILFAVAVTAGYARARRPPRSATGRARSAIPMISSAVSLLLFVGLTGYAMQGARYDGEPVHLSSPLRGGTFYVGQGGDSPLINYHNTHATQRFALDILELNAIGMRAASLHPSRLERYVIFGRDVRSPCRGNIISVQDGLVDNIPPESDTANPAGNHIIVACHGVRVFLAHLQQGSVTVQAGDQVSVGEFVGRVGNSGNTSEPHLHLHAVREAGDRLAGEGTPVAILLDGRFPVRNTILRDVD